MRMFNALKRANVCFDFAAFNALPRFILTLIRWSWLKYIEVCRFTIIITLTAIKDVSFDQDPVKAIIPIHITIKGSFSCISWDIPWLAKTYFSSSFNSTFKFTCTLAVRLEHFQVFALMWQPALALLKCHFPEFLSGSNVICNYLKGINST